ncbi:MAG: dephospho-CoA kinase [Verrucomicrobia bacterium RIFCSPLOWO2_12_FULL_64_8]|nr:MAG: dephospho-CoA kinase [Verrucomicrobia bacterium RIFCSPLOWO2_12_FULL_64_8]
MILGLTGGMGCGKSCAAQMVAAHGFAWMDSDEIVRNKLLLEQDVMAAIRDHFGPEVITPAAGVDRSRLAHRVFADSTGLVWLENLIHPKLFEYWRRVFAKDRTKSWVVEVPLLFEKSLQNWFDFTICVASHPAVQFARLEQRGIPLPLARQRISKQLPLARKIESADFVLWNDGSTGFLRQQVDLLIKSLVTR